MSASNDLKNAQRIYDKVGKRKLNIEEKKAMLRQHTNWNEEKIQRIAKKEEESA